MKHISLFSGIGGFDLAAEWMGWENVAHCEWNPFGQKILKYYWPNAHTHTDITTTDFSVYRGQIDIVTGGFPCQPYSTAGKRKGKEDDRHLWPEMLRAIREIKPTWIVGENVLGLVNWNGGLVFEEVQAQLESEGYEVQPFLLPAASVGAPHQRYRIWFVAHCNDRLGQHEDEEVQTRRNAVNNLRRDVANTRSDGHESGRFVKSRSEEKESKGKGIQRERIRSNTRGVSKKGIATNSNIPELQRVREEGNTSEEGKDREERKWLNFSSDIQPDWEKFPTQSPICDGDDGLSVKLDGITFPKFRNESIKAGGNAIVPQVAYQIFNAINQYEQLNKYENSSSF